MRKATTLSLTYDQHQELLGILQADNNVTEALLVCGARRGDRRHRLLVKQVRPMADGEGGASGDGALLLARRADGTEVQTSGMGTRVNTSGSMVGSILVAADGLLSGAIKGVDGADEPLNSICVAGEDLLFWYPRAGTGGVPEFAASHAQAFGAGTTDTLRRLSVAVVGCSGSGSPVIEQLARLGVRELVLVDDDVIEERNVNRILGSTMADASARRLKVDVLADAVRRIGLGTRVVTVPHNVWTPEAVREVAQCDVLFGCVDTVDARFLMNLLGTYYTIPYFDIGIKLDAVPDGPDRGKIREVCGSVHYLQPGLSSFMSRGVFDMERVRSAGLQRTDPIAAAREADEGYISGVHESRPAVISVNTLAASLAVTDFLARLHPFRETPNRDCAHIEFSLASTEFLLESETGPCSLISGFLGHGDVDPLLRQSELS